MKSVLLVGVDGLQPAQMTPGLMPNLSAWAAGGVTFDNHHSVFPTVTRTNVVSMLTGRYPGGHGLVANNLLLRDFDVGRAIPASKRELTEVMEKTGRLLLAPHLADILDAHGREFVAVGVGSNGNAFLQNPNAGRSGGATIHPEFCLPDGLHDELVSRFGPWPEKRPADEERLSHALRILTEYVLGERSPAAAMLWCSNLDSAQHATGVGSELAERSLAVVDRQFGSLLAWLERSGRAADTDVMVVSDHGYSTISGTVEVAAWLRDEGFPPAGRQGGVVAAPNGGSVLFYVHNRDRATADRLAARLMRQRWCGALLASEAMDRIPGTLPAALVGLEGARVPDLTMSFAWDSTSNRHGFQGHIYSTAGALPAGPGLGMHGSMSRHEQRCVLIARGPSFKTGLALATPSGNVDLAPTVLHILGVDGGEDIDGRVLREALAGGPEPGSVVWSTEVSAAERLVEGGVYRQRITVSRPGKTTYVDEGRASLDPA